MIFAVCFTNFGPYHLARLRALATRLREAGDCLIAYEVAGNERTYPWDCQRQDEPFDWITLFPDRDLETLSPAECAGAITRMLDRDLPDAVGIVGYARPESMAAARWCRRSGRPAILMSESQAVDRPRTWWKEMIKARRVRLFDAALVGGEPHRDYLVDLGMPADRIALGYNAVDNAFYRDRAEAWRARTDGREGLPEAPFFLSVCRFVPEKNLHRLIEAFAVSRPIRTRRRAVGPGPLRRRPRGALDRRGDREERPRRGDPPARVPPGRAAHADGMPTPGPSCSPASPSPGAWSSTRPRAPGLPLLVSRAGGLRATLVPEPEGTTGARFDPLDVEEMTQKLAWMAVMPDEARGWRWAGVRPSWSNGGGPTGSPRGPSKPWSWDARTHAKTHPLTG